MARKIINKAEAKKLGLKTYYTGKPCPNGHIDEIFVNGRCRTCTLESARRNREKAKTGKARATKARVAVAATVVAVTPITDEWQSYADRIAATWQQAVESIIETGKLLIEAKDKLKHGEWQDMLQLLPFGERTAERLMAIARHPVLSDATHVSVLPPSWGTLYELTRVPDDLLLARIEDHTINPDMQRKDITAITDETGGRSKTGKRAKSKLRDESITTLSEENEDLREHIAELEAARECGVYIDGDEPTLARKIVMVIGKERAALLIVELQKLLRSEAA
jgi:hypothetical protein